jgi:tRNA modification GTPase
MFAPDDTIVAVATPPGRGGIGVVRISGPAAADVARVTLERDAPLEPRRATFARLRASVAGTQDEVVATLFAAPASYTGEHVVEISAHGNPVVLEGIVRQALDAGARLARPGEFTLRAFLNGKRDLVQAEAVADLIAAATPLQARVAVDQLEGTLTRRIAGIDADLLDLIVRLEASLDFPDEGYHFIEPGEVAVRAAATIARVDVLLADAARGRMIREGALVVLAGRTNVGKSSLFNALAGAERAIVTAVAGTTRDLVTERVDIEGLPVTLVDTAGARESTDAVEREGVTRGAQARLTADLVLVVLDRTESLTCDDWRVLDETSGLRRLVVINKSDRPAAASFPSEVTVPGPAAPGVAAGPGTAHEVSASTGDGLPALRRAMAAALTGTESLRDSGAVCNVRHTGLLREARGHLAAAQQAAAAGGTPEECVVTDLQAARRCFDEIVGTRTSEDILRSVFERFCIGK